ncbi:MAG TPA: acyl-CoA dehydratase activase [Candidatus Dormibacteraeota bacterium]|nr:acyl-CoA dehydratase activase [Candidatus Dormibacteraeota bacterium]
MLVGGVDVGSTQTKAVVMDGERRVLGRALIDTGGIVTAAAENAFALAVTDAGIDRREVAYVVGTGYGRYKVTFGDTQVTEISCHARGGQYLFPRTRTVLDIGGQDTKAIRIGSEGQVLDFCMNDKCAAGTGRFLGAAAMALDIPLGELGPLALVAKNPVKITTTCTVFAETEIINWLARGKKMEDVLMGVHQAIATRSISLLRRVGIESELTFTGGVTRNLAMVRILEEMLEMHLNVSEEAHYMGAIGASLFALDKAASGAAGALEAITVGDRLDATRKAAPACDDCEVPVLIKVAPRMPKVHAS